jgi:AcrR family transcriptional regulator
MHRMSLAERKRQLVRDELAEAALQLLARQGYVNTTVEHIVAAAGVSRRTFFRHFQSKEDVLVQFLSDLGARMCAEIAARPAGEAPPVALRETLMVFVQDFQVHPEKALALTRLIFDTPALRARYVERQDRWRGDLAAELARRTGAADDDLRPALTAAAALAALDVALAHWVSGGGTGDVCAVVDKALQIAVPNLPPPDPAPAAQAHPDLTGTRHIDHGT